MSWGEPQRLATWVLTRCAPDYSRESFIGDLIEQYEERGGWWYWRQVLSAVRAHAVTALLAAKETRVPAAEFVDDLIMSIALGTVGCCQLPFCAFCLFGWATLGRSGFRLAENALLGGALIGALTVAHTIRMRKPRQPCIPHICSDW